MRLLGNLAGVFATLGAVALLALVLSLWRISSGLPNYEHLANYTPPVMSRVHAGDGSLIAEYAQERVCSCRLMWCPNTYQCIFGR